MNIMELQNSLDDLSAWRKNELLQAHFLAENAESVESRRYLCRAWVLMMYAHCDNFLKEAAKSYLAYVKATPNTYYRPDLMWLIMRAKNVLTEGNDGNYKSLEDYRKIKNDHFFEVILGDDVFNKKSFQYKLLRFFCDWVLQINYEHGKFSDFCERLKEKRNSIAHGEQMYADVAEDCMPWHEKTMQFIDSFKDSLVESARNSIH